MTNKAVEFINEIGARIEALSDKDCKRLMQDAHTVQHDVRDEAARHIATGIILAAFRRVNGEVEDE